MKARWGMRRLRVLFPVLAFTTLLLAATLVTEKTPGIPSPFNPNETSFQNQTHFLVFTGSDTAGENAATATAYYNTIDPFPHQKKTFPEWLAKNGFIGNTSQWRPTGPQIIACDLPGCDLPSHQPDGSLTYGDNIINTDSHAIVLNAADLGFVRNQFIRCVPSCTAPNPIIYTYLENYPVNPFAGAGVNGTGSGFPIKTGYPTPTEAAAAIASALKRPSDFDTSNTAFTSCIPANTDTAFKCKTSRIADVAFEWAPPASNPSSSTRFGQLYAYIFADGPSPTETIAMPAALDTIAGIVVNPPVQAAPNVATRTLQPFNTDQSTGVSSVKVTAGGAGYSSAPIVTLTGGGGTGATATATIKSGVVTTVTLTNVGSGYSSAPSVSLTGGGGSGAAATASLVNSYTGTIADPFPPNLDFVGFKQHPGVCFICHGGKPANPKNGVYPNQGNVSGFRYLPLDIRNLMFTSDQGTEQPALPTSKSFTSRAMQEQQIKAYNLAVLQTVPTGMENDGTGSTRVAHLREVITGWYTDPGGTLFGRATQNVDFIPVAWRDSAASEQLYQQVVSPSCRSCHFNREISLDFGTPANFKQESDLQQFALLPGCSVLRPNDYGPKAGAKYMPLAHLTYQRYWQANTSTGGGTQTLHYPAVPTPPNPLQISSTADQIASYFGFSDVMGYCATNP